MVLSDRTIRREIEAGNLVIDPLGEDAVQPASVVKASLTAMKVRSDQR